MSRILFQKKNECCGCEACANICPMHIIEMKPDEEGFFYPEIINEDKCINCNMCEKVCPLKNVKKSDDFKEDAYAGYADSDEKIKTCASGGLATEMSETFIKNGGIVYGVRYNQSYTEAVYERVSSADKLESLKTSKYIQSRKYDVYNNVKLDLKDDKAVLFIGLPCDCNALHSFLNKSYEKLYVCALICHGTTSSEVHRQYCDSINTEKKPITFFTVRYKPYGWKPYFIRMLYEDKIYEEQFNKSNYGTAFLFFKRPSCNTCKIKRSAIKSDLTIGDFHLSASSAGKIKPYNINGVSSAIVHTEKGKKLITGIKHFLISNISVKQALYSEAYVKAIPAKKNRNEFGKVFALEGLNQACNLKSIAKIEKKERNIHLVKSKCATIKHVLIKIKNKFKG